MRFNSDLISSVKVNMVIESTTHTIDGMLSLSTPLGSDGSGVSSGPEGRVGASLSVGLGLSV